MKILEVKNEAKESIPTKILGAMIGKKQIFRHECPVEEVKRCYLKQNISGQ